MSDLQSVMVAYRIIEDRGGTIKITWVHGLTLVRTEDDVKFLMKQIFQRAAPVVDRIAQNPYVMMDIDAESPFMFNQLPAGVRYVQREKRLVITVDPGELDPETRAQVKKSLAKVFVRLCKKHHPVFPIIVGLIVHDPQ